MKFNHQQTMFNFDAETQPVERAPIQPKRQTQAAKILARLQQGSATNIELNKTCFRYSARIHELRKAGHRIARTKVEEGIFSYALTDKGLGTDGRPRLTGIAAALCGTLGRHFLG